MKYFYIICAQGAQNINIGPCHSFAPRMDVTTCLNCCGCEKWSFLGLKMCIAYAILGLKK